MGSYIELNDALQITTEQGFPEHELNVERHRRSPLLTADFSGKVYEFHGKQGARVYHPAPNRCFLIHNKDGKWIYWGRIVMVEQTISGEDRETQTTSGKYRITEIYDPEYQEQATRHESPEGLSFF